MINLDVLDCGCPIETDQPCIKCCDHSDIGDDEPCCLICGKDMSEHFSATAYDRAKDRD